MAQSAGIRSANSEARFCFLLLQNVKYVGLLAKTLKSMSKVESVVIGIVSCIPLLFVLLL